MHGVLATGLWSSFGGDAVVKELESSGSTSSEHWGNFLTSTLLGRSRSSNHFHAGRILV